MFDRARFCERALDLRTRCFEDEASVLVLLSYRVVLSLSLSIYIYISRFDSIRSDGKSIRDRFEIYWLILKRRLCRDVRIIKRAFCDKHTDATSAISTSE